MPVQQRRIFALCAMVFRGLKYPLFNFRVEVIMSRGNLPQIRRQSMYSYMYPRITGTLDSLIFLCILFLVYLEYSAVTR